MSIFFAGLFILLLSVLPSQFPSAEANQWNSGPTANPQHPHTWIFTGRGTGGFVQSIGKDEITLYRPETELRRFRHHPLTGQQLGLEKETLPAWSAKKFRLGEELGKGSYVKTASADRSYRIADVCVGDWIAIEYDRINGVDVCKTISIHRRPGGLIPVAPGEKPDAFRKYHEQANADQAWEERRVAYPRKYWPTYRGQDGKFYAGPYPSESIQTIIKLPAAPHPREVMSRGSPTEP